MLGFTSRLSHIFTKKAGFEAFRAVGVDSAFPTGCVDRGQTKLSGGGSTGKRLLHACARGLLGPLPGSKPIFEFGSANAVKETAFCDALQRKEGRRERRLL